MERKIAKFTDFAYSGLVSSVCTLKILHDEKPHVPLPYIPDNVRCFYWEIEKIISGIFQQKELFERLYFREQN